LRNFFGAFATELRNTMFGPEIWTLYERGTLTPQTVLTGRYERPAGAVDLVEVMREIDDARAEEAARLLRMA
jgi:RIO kinase 1